MDKSMSYTVNDWSLWEFPRERIPRVHIEFPLSSLISRFHLTRNFSRLIVPLTSENFIWKELIFTVKFIQEGWWFPKEIKWREICYVSIVIELYLYYTSLLKKHTPGFPCRCLSMWRRLFSTHFYFSSTLTPRQIAWAPVRRQGHNLEDNRHCRHKVFGRRDDNWCSEFFPASSSLGWLDGLPSLCLCHSSKISPLFWCSKCGWHKELHIPWRH